MGLNLSFKGLRTHKTSHEDLDGELKYSFTLSLTSALDVLNSHMPRLGRFTPGKKPLSTVLEVGLAPGTVWSDMENLATTGIRSPDHPAHNELLCRLRYTDQQRHK